VSEAAKSLGQRLYETMLAVAPEVGLPSWSSCSVTGQATWERAAVGFVAKLSSAPTELIIAASNSSPR
jgi:hypothetical protein